MSLRLVSGTDPSFPSGHATNSAAVFCTIAFVAAVFVLRRPLARDAAIVLATVLSGAVGLSRLVLGVHWPSDVLAGWALGVAVALGVTIAATLLVGLMPTDPTPPRGWLRRAAVLVGRLLTLERRTIRRHATLQAA